MPTRFDESKPFAPPAQIQFKHAEKDRPEFIREATGASLALPLIAGLLAFVGVGLIVLALGWSVRWALCASGLAVLGVGVYWTLDNKSIMNTTEVIEGIEPPALPAPQEPPVTVWQMPNLGGHSLARGAFDVPEELLTEWCRTAYREGPLSFSVWVSKFSAAFRGRGREEFEKFRQTWIDKGLGVDVKGNKGLTLTDAGWDFCESALRMRGLLLTPPPAQLGDGEPE